MTLPPSSTLLSQHRASLSPRSVAVLLIPHLGRTIVVACLASSVVERNHSPPTATARRRVALHSMRRPRELCFLTTFPFLDAPPGSPLPHCLNPPGWEAHALVAGYRLARVVRDQLVIALHALLRITCHRRHRRHRNHDRARFFHFLSHCTFSHENVKNLCKCDFKDKACTPR